MPADVPHLRPAGSSPQFLVTTGLGLGSPSPVIGLATGAGFGFARACAVFRSAAVTTNATATTPRLGSRIRDRTMTTLLEVAVSRAEVGSNCKGLRNTSGGCPPGRDRLIMPAVSTV